MPHYIQIGGTGFIQTGVGNLIQVSDPLPPAPVAETFGVEHITDHSDQAVALFIEQFQAKPRLEALLRSYTDQCQAIEDAAWEVITSRILDNATNTQLDGIGKLVGRVRQGETDDLYRLYIQAQILGNRSRGQVSDIIAVSTLLLGALAFSYLELYPRSFIVDVTDPMSSDQIAETQAMSQLIFRAKPVGVGASLHYSDVDISGEFLFSATDSNDIDSAHGLSDDSGTVGGQLIGAW